MQFQLFKKRKFSQLVGDTFDFFKIYGKSYFGNYITINGGLLLLLVVLLFLLGKVFYDGIFASAGSANFDSVFLSYLQNNLGVFIGSGLLIALLVIAITMLNYTYPIAFLYLIENNKPTTRENIIAFMKSKIGKVAKFFLLSILVLIPIYAVVMVAMVLLIMIIIGIPLLFIILPALLSWISLSYYNYITTDDDYFASLGVGFDLLKQNFWSNIGSTIIMFIIMQSIMGAVFFIPYLIGIASIFTNPEMMDNNNMQDSVGFLVVLMGVLYMVLILTNYFIQNLLLINQGIIFYSAKEEKENTTQKSAIDLIGKD